MPSVLLQIEGSLDREFNHQLRALKRFILWADKSKQFSKIRQVELSEFKNAEILLYNKTTMAKYQQYIWLTDSLNHCLRHEESCSNDNVKNIISHINSQEILLNHANSIFTHKTTKKEDGFLLDYMHGNSLIFGKCRKNLPQYQVASHCYFCGNYEDSAEHQLFHCKEVQDNTISEFTSKFPVPNLFLNEIIVSTDHRDSSHQKIFINRVRKLLDKHNEIRYI